MTTLIPPKKTLIVALIAVAGLAISPLAAQTNESLDPEYGARISLAADKKLSRGLHLRLEEEIRWDNNFSEFNRFHTTLGLTYKLNQNIKLGVGYALINPYSSSNSTFKSSRHRLMLDATYGIRLGNWRLSLKERVQGTYRTGDMNTYQQPRLALALKSRFKVQYKNLQRWEPYAYLEIRNTLNSYAVSAYYDGSAYLTASGAQYGDEGWFISGRSAYINRLRGCMGASYRIDKRSTIDFSLLADYNIEKVIDANAEGTKLKSYTRQTGFDGWVALGYTYAF